MDFVALQKHFESFNQAHVFSHLQELNEVTRKKLFDDLSALDLGTIGEAFKVAMRPSSGEKELIEPLPAQYLMNLAEVKENEEAFKFHAFREIGGGKVAAVVLAGGQGSRLGFEGPKGAYNASFPSKKTLFQIQVERLLHVQALSGVEAACIPLYVMTSPLNEAETIQHFESNQYFGMNKEDVFFFSQGTLPCLTNEGKLMLETPYSICSAPDGNGGLFTSLKVTGALNDMQRRGVKYIHVYAIDNPMVIPADPVFVGGCLHKQVQAGNFCIPKLRFDEKVGVSAMRNKKFHVVEYSEISKEMASSRNEKNELLFGSANICCHFFTLDFIEHVVIPGMRLSHHVARKKIPCLENPEPKENNGIKLELFIFDAFSLAHTFLAMEFARESTFSPIKNAKMEDSPESARAAVTLVNEKLLLSNGFRIINAGDCEISSLLTLYGEGLGLLSSQDDATRITTLAKPFYLDISLANSKTFTDDTIGLKPKNKWRIIMNHSKSQNSSVYVYEVVPVANVFKQEEVREDDEENQKKVNDILSQVNLSTTTPMEALFILEKLKKKATV